PPRFFGGLFLYNLPSNLWTICYDRTVSVAKQLGLHVDICPDKGIICTNSMFWARTKALDPLLRYEWKYEDFEGEPTPVDGALRHVIERILQFVAQDAGYYTGIVMTPEYAAIQTSAFFHLVQREMRRGLELENALHQATDPVHWAAKKRTRSARDWLKRRVSVEKWTQLRKLYYKLGGKGIE
ncbi:MAG: rhamnan synthesis F family protein, partial [Clostridiaceae bacterium]|nr:rhamnan synthesis F family protein [Clostridiaceae bacterium]